ncbi:MAG: tRNA (adenosine(37)-N6)-threonylcarbamoyltransferase complex dimerization subunit type 1 TsaB [Lachnospiraceae bacterium]|nr:tRNA (adenosine(37)-N6)-threonylcarbamoyltransferase complex dimerization subunit type 1 TsaB [Lachnospiraceae bacterium]
MKIIGLDSSGLTASVALVSDSVLTAEYTVEYKKTHSQTLLPMLDEIKRMCELDLSKVDAIAVASGPGSFTGLRIGSATAKGLALALDIPIVEVPTLEGIAMNMWGSEKLICPLMDARRDQVYTAIYEFKGMGKDYRLNALLAPCAVSVEELLINVNAFGREIIFLGDGAPVHEKYICDNVKERFSFAPAGRNRQRGANIALLGEIYFSEGKGIDPDLHAPEYFRVSQAEREKAEREGRAK